MIHQINHLNLRQKIGSKQIMIHAGIITKGIKLDLKL